jgi:hypothetical protein
VCFFHTALRARETNVVDALLGALERKGFACAGAFGLHPTTLNIMFTLG